MHYPIFIRIAVLAIAGAVMATAAACSDDTPSGPSNDGRTGTVVLNGVGDPGVTVIATSGGSTRVPFGSEFDGTVMTVRGDSVISTSSSFGGNQLFVADAAAGTLRKVQLPANSNPSGAAFVVRPTASAADGHQYAVALRNTSQVALVTLRGAAEPTIQLLGAAGRCPYDVVPRGQELWSVDANVQCATTYAVAGPGRLIRVPLGGATRDTVPLGAAVVNPLRAIPVGDVAYVFSAGCSPFSQGCELTPAAVAEVDLARRQVTRVLPFPAQTYGVNAGLGADGLIYVTAASTLFGPSFDPHVYTVDPRTLQFVGPFAPGRSYRALAKAGGAYPVCFAASADREGNVHCVENGDVAATLLIFDRGGTQVRSAPAGSLAFDVVAR